MVGLKLTIDEDTERTATLIFQYCEEKISFVTVFSVTFDSPDLYLIAQSVMSGEAHHDLILTAPSVDIFCDDIFCCILV